MVCILLIRIVDSSGFSSFAFSCDGFVKRARLISANVERSEVLPLMVAVISLTAGWSSLAVTQPLMLL